MPPPNPSRSAPTIRVSGAVPGAGHSAEFLANPALFMLRAWRECGELAEFDLGGVRNILMVGPEAHEAVYRAPDDQLSAVRALQVHGPGVRRGHPVRRAASDRAPAGEVPDPRAAPGEDEGLCARDRARGGGVDRELGRRGRARLLRRVQGARAAHVDALPDGLRVPRQAHRGVRRAVPRSRAGDLAAGRARRALARRGVRAARPRARAAPGDAHGDRARAAPHAAATTPTCSRCS